MHKEHNSQKMGANLTWTALWLTLCAMHNHHGFWPEMLHFTLDNTSGHTHVIIDHIFGVITVGLRRSELLVRTLA